MTRKHISLKTKLAAALLQMVRYDDHQAEFVRVIPYAESKGMTADQIIAMFHFDHGIPHAWGGPDEPWNLTPVPVEEHREKTARVDVPRIAKAKRIRKREAGERKPRSIRAWRKFDRTAVYARRDRE